MKAFIKSVFYKTGTAKILDNLVYLKGRLYNHTSNKRFLKEHPNFKLPPDYYLYETNQLNYSKYLTDGEGAAKEMIEWSSPYLENAKQLRILDWGCGVARVIRHLEKYVLQSTELYGCDINSEMISWNKENIDNVQFSTIDYNPPTEYNSNFFDFVYAISIFTHIETANQKHWVEEIARILKPNGIFIFSTHGKNCFNTLTTEAVKELNTKGEYNSFYSQKGHRMMSTYNTKENFLSKIDYYFDLLEHYDGTDPLKRIGHQDVWIVRKKDSIKSSYPSA